MLLADFIRHQAIVSLTLSKGRVIPAEVKDGWSDLRGTRWEHEIDFSRFLTNDFANDHYDALTLAVDPKRVAEGVDTSNRALEAIRQRRNSDG